MTIALVEQVVGANSGKDSTLDIVLSSAPTSGSLLVVGVNEEATEVPTLNNGSWTALNTSTYLGGHLVAWWYKIAAGTESATTTLTWTGGTAAVGALLEFSNTEGWRQLGSEAAIATGSSSSPGSNTVGGNSDEFLHVGLVGMDGNQTYSSPTNSYTLGTHQVRGNVVCIQAIYRILTTETTLDWDVTASGSNDWFATHLAFETDVSADQTAAPIFDGSGDIVLTVSVDVPASPVLDGSGDVVLTAQVDVPVTLTLDGSGDVVLTTSTDVPSAPVFDGTGDIVLAYDTDVPVTLTLDGTGDVALTTDVSGDVDGAHIYDGTGDVVLVVAVDVPAAPTLDGSGDVVLAYGTDVPVSLTLDGVGDVVLAAAITDQGVAPVFDGVGDVQLVTQVSGAGGQEILTLRMMGY